MNTTTAYEWAEAELISYFLETERLTELHERADKQNQRVLRSMINELNEKIAGLYRYVSLSEEMESKIDAIVLRIESRKRKQWSWSPQILQEIAVAPISVEDEAINRACPEVPKSNEKKRVDLTILTKQQRKILLHISDGMTRSGVAEMYGYKKGTINKHLFLAKVRILNRESANCLPLINELNLPPRSIGNEKVLRSS